MLVHLFHFDGSLAVSKRNFWDILSSQFINNGQGHHGNNRNKHLKVTYCSLNQRLLLILLSIAVIKTLSLSHSLCDCFFQDWKECKQWMKSPESQMSYNFSLVILIQFLRVLCAIYTFKMCTHCTSMCLICAACYRTRPLLFQPKYIQGLSLSPSLPIFPFSLSNPKSANANNSIL